MKPKTIVFFALPALAVCVAVTLFLLQATETKPVPSSSIEPDKLRELERRAATGDAAAQYTLTLFLDDPARIEALLKTAADAGYPPAVVTMAQATMSKGASEGVVARGRLEAVAKGGYYPAIIELAHCLSQGDCGPESGTDALTWALVSGLLAQQNKIAANELKDEELRLRATLSANEVARAEANAELLAKGISSVVR